MMRARIAAMFARRGTHDASAAEASDSEARDMPGDRGVSPTFRAHSLQTRLTNFVALGLGVLVMSMLLLWYYQHAFAQRPGERTRGAPPARAAASALPPLGRIDPPLMERVLGPVPPLSSPMTVPEARETTWPDARDLEPTQARRSDPAGVPDRRLSGEAFVPAGGRATLVARDELAAAESMPGVAAPSATATISARGRSELSDRLAPTALAAAQAQVLPTRRLLLPKGSFVDCTLETAIDSTLPGMTTCVTATDTFGADGSVVLLERGSKLIGETRGEVRAGSHRVFVLWSEARTPTGVVVPLASPGTDALGRSGLPGEVDRHFWDRFGAAILISVIDGAVQAAVQRDTQGDAVIVNPAGSKDVMTEVLKSTIHIPPTVTVRHGERIAVLVARDLDFRSVYELRAASDR